MQFTSESSQPPPLQPPSPCLGNIPALPVRLHETDRGHARLCCCRRLPPSTAPPRLPAGHRCAQCNLSAGCPWLPADRNGGVTLLQVAPLAPS